MTTAPSRPARRDETPEALRSERAFYAFGWYLRWYFWRRFRAVRVSLSGLPSLPPGRPAIIYGNHPSWWDPAFYLLLAAMLFRGRRGYGPMDATALGKYGVLAKMGIFGIDSDTTRGAARFLTTSRRLMADPLTMLWITAEGGFRDVRQRPIELRAGLAHLVRHVPDAVVIPLAIEYTFWNESRPEALARFGVPLDAGTTRSVPEWTALLERELTRTMDALQAESSARDPALFRPLIRGGAGVGGIYDLYRRARALLAGRRFDSTHEGRQ